MSTEAGREEKREEKAKRKRKKGKMRKKVGGHVNGKQNHVFIDCQGLHCQWFQIPFIGGSKIPPGFLGHKWESIGWDSQVPLPLTSITLSQVLLAERFLL